MAQFHISKDPLNQTPIANVYTPLTRYIILERHEPDSKYASFWLNKLNQPPAVELYGNNRKACYTIY